MDIDSEEITVRFDEASKGKNPVDVEAESNTKEGSSMQVTKKPVVEDLWKPVLPLNYLFPPDYEFYKNDAQQLWCLFGDGTPIELLDDHFLQFSRIDNSTGMPMYKLKNMPKYRYEDDYLSMYQYLIIDDVGSCIPKTTKHISVRGSIDSSFFDNLYEIEALKTLFILRGDGPRLDRLPYDLFRKLPYLQALDLSHTGITELPSSIRFSQQLRHLNLSYTSIVELPNSVCNILTLETLNLRGCLKLRSLPKAIRRLTSLKHLDVDVSCLLVSMPPGVGDLCQLQTLPAFVVGKQYGWHINELKNLKYLRQNLRVLRLENLSSPEQAKEASLHSKYHLQKLEFHWSRPEDGFEVLESLRPGQYIQELQIVGYGGAKFPSWIGEPSFFCLTTITIHNCSKSNVLPSLGKLRSLKFLHISDMDEVKAIDQHFSGNSIIDHENTVEAFAMLEQLTFIGMPELNQWVGVGEGDFPRLQKLKISHCPKLQILPKLSLFSSLQQLQISLSHSLESFPDGEFPISLQSIVIVECPKLKERYHKDIGENWEKLAHITDIWIDYEKISLSTKDPLVENMTSDIDNDAVQDQESIKSTKDPLVENMTSHVDNEAVQDQESIKSTKDPLVENMTSDIDNEAVQDQESIKKLEEREISKVAEGWKKLSIYKVPICTKNLHKNVYVPLTVSFGPYHCEEKMNKLMEAHKFRALSHFLRKSNKPLETYVNELKKVVQQLLDCYQHLDSNWDQNRFLQLMLLDGCFMLEILRAYGTINSPADKYEGYGVDDPLFSYHGRVYVMPHIRRDMLMLENQIPMLLLVNLVTVEGTIPDPVEYLNKLVLKFVNPGTKLPPAHMMDPRTNKPWEQGDSLHVLDLYRKSLLGFGLVKVSAVVIPPGTSENAQDIVRSAEELHQAGVEFKTSQTNSLTDISFARGILKLPVIIIDDTSEPAFLNLMVFERLHVGAGNEVTSFISFMANIIDSAKDVSLLHSDGIIHNSFGCEEAVANMFNGISKDVTPDPEDRLEKVHYLLNAYCNKGWNSHIAYLMRTYFKNPWAFAAIFLLILTLAQTVYTIKGFHLPNKQTP